MKVKRTGMRCSVRFCNKKAGVDKGVSFFSYPREADRREFWIKNCQTEGTVDLDPESKCSSRVCGNHFESRMFLNACKRNRLVFNAVPTLFNDYILDQREKLKRRTIYSELISDIDKDVSSDDDDFLENPFTMPSVSNKNSSTQTPSHPPESPLNNFQQALENEKVKVEQLQKTVIYLSRKLITYESKDSVVKLCEKYLSKGLHSLIKSHID